MASRLDRLVTILETGSTKLIRDTAVNQLADWQKQHPDELFNLLSRVVPYLRHKEWETRRTAANAIGKIVEQAPLFEPNADSELDPKDETNIAKKEEISENGNVKKEEEEDTETALNSAEGFKLDTLVVQNVIK